MYMKVLTAHRLTGSEDLGYFRIHVDHHILLCLDLIIPLLHLRPNTNRKWVPNNSIYEVGDVLTWELLYFLLYREVFVDSRILASKALHILNRESLKLWHIDMFDVSRLNALLCP